ncbi:MAG: hypothetical protein ACE5FT_02965 [Candidatus Nanoarchaeia archaeon]
MDQRRDELHLDIDNYIHQRRKMDPAKKEKGTTDLEVYHDENKKPGLLKRFFGWFKKKPEEPIPEEPVPEQPVFQHGEIEEVPNKPQRKGLLKRLLSLFVKEEEIIEELPETMEEVADAKEDLKVLAKLFLSTLEQLPPEELKKFKQTDEFKNFKDILRRHNVIK